MSRRFQFSLKWLLAATSIVAVLAGLLCWRIRSQNAAIAMIQQKGGAVVYSDSLEGEASSTTPQSPAWLRPLDGFKVKMILLTGRKFSDDDLRTLTVFHRLDRVLVGDDTTVTKAGVEWLKQRLPDCSVKQVQIVNESVGGVPVRAVRVLDD